MSPNNNGNGNSNYRPWGQKVPSQNILIPMEVDSENNVTDFFMLDTAELPAGGQGNLLEICGSHISEGLAGLTIHQDLNGQVLQKGYTGTLLKLARSIDHCDSHTRYHGPHTSEWCRRLAIQLGFDREEVEAVALAGKIHDVGKVLIPREILTKPSRLDVSEWDLVKQHPNYGAMIIQPSIQLHSIIPFIQAHHEHYDGSGYPNGLSGNHIPMGARIVSVSDAFTTMTAGRIYKAAYSVQEALEEIFRCSGTQFDPLVVEALHDLFTCEMMEAVM